MIFLVALLALVLLLAARLIVRQLSRGLANSLRDAQITRCDHSLCPALPSELCYHSVDCELETSALPSLDDPASLALSIIVPAFNEAARLPAMLDDCLAHLAAREAADYEVVVVSDGSTDSTVTATIAYARSRSIEERARIRLIDLRRNRGKGGAVKHGMLHARGAVLLFVDADGASRFADLAALEKHMARLLESTEHGLVIGSRAHMVNTPAVVQRSRLRNLLMRCFHLYLRLLGVHAVQDTQCGFKLFSRASARLLFGNLHTTGWIFDIELLLLAQQFGIPVIEVPIAWNEVPGSKMSVARDGVNMALDLLAIRFNYMTGRWRASR